MPTNPDPNTIYQILLVILAASNGLGALGTFIQAIKGRPSVKREEFDEHKNQVFARLGGINEKLNEAIGKLDGKLDKFLEKHSELLESVARHEGLLQKGGDR